MNTCLAFQHFCCLGLFFCFFFHLFSFPHGGGECWSLFQLSWGKGRVIPWTSRRFIAGPQERQTTIHTGTHTYGQPGVPNSPHVPVFGLWEGGAVPGENPRRHKETCKPHADRPQALGFEPATFSLCADGADHCTAAVAPLWHVHIIKSGPCWKEFDTQNIQQSDDGEIRNQHKRQFSVLGFMAV